ncbi:MAG: discoidin domain-containing protein, partial [Muribaculaceae bacterium]|nr:discoidin domain-containing protein [Muribaculaceae bacterium]
GDDPTVYAVSNAHLDTQWNWDVQTTIRDYVKKTLSQNLFLLSQYPDYVFNFEGGVKYAWMKEYYPEQYELVKDYVKNGRWHITGASWDANDVIMPSVESQIRNIMLGQNFYRDEFGVESTDIFLPDCFGFGWTLPTIANHCGLLGFSSQKLGWRHKPFYPDGKKYPYTIGLWKGVDGEEIMMAHGFNYNFRWRGEDISESEYLKKLADENPMHLVYHYYGTGDTGGSPSIGSVEAVEKGVNGAGPVKIVSATSDQLYKDMLPYASHKELPVFEGELLMDVHGTGCYTSQAAMKLYNRQNEQLGDAAERAAAVAALYAGHEYPTEALTEAWKRFIFHQFHDDLTGTSIPRAYEFSWNDELLSLKQFSDLLTDAATSVAAELNTNVGGTPVLLFNPLGYETTDIVEIEVPAKVRPAQAVVKDHNGKQVKAQVKDFADGKATLLVEATVPAVGYAVYDVALKGKGATQTAKGVKGVENSVYSIKFDKNGDIASLVDKRNGKEMVAPGKTIGLAMFKENKSYSWPAWEVMKETVDAEPEAFGEDVTIELVADGDVMKSVKVSKKYGDSEFTQYVNLYEGALAPRIDFVNEVDWATTNALVKAAFPLSVSNEKAAYDLGLGVIERGNNVETAYEVPAREWADLSDGKYGVTVLNNSKYGWDKPNDNTLRLTLLHTPATKNGYTYQDHQDMGHHEFTYSIVGHEGALDRVETAKAGERLNQRVKAFIVPKSKGEGRSMSLASTDAPNVAIKALKKAEDGNGYVVRVYETSGKPTAANVVFSRNIKSAKQADGTEKVIGDVAAQGNKLPVSLKANGVGTYRVQFDEPEGVKLNMAQVELPYNRNVMTWNGFRSEGGLSGGYSYAGEIMPEEIVSSGVSFAINKKPYNNAVVCNGDTVALPAGNWSKLHLLMAADTDSRDVNAVVKIGNQTDTLVVPSYTGFIGQWGHDGHTEGYMKEQRVAYTGTHRHSPAADEPHEYTYMFEYTMDVPAGATSVILPKNRQLVLFAATVTSGEAGRALAAAPLFKTANRPVSATEEATYPNLLKPEMIVSCSGYVNDREKPEYMVDGNMRTKWCDVKGNPPTVVFDLGNPTEIHGWKLVSAGEEDPSYVTAGGYLLGRSSIDEDWHTIDALSGNRQNVVNRKLAKPETVRYVKLMLTSPTQDAGEMTSRIYEMEVF